MNENEIEEIKENTLYFLYRRGKHEHIQALYENGDLYINTIDSIRKCDQNEDRSDAYDGISSRNFLGDIKVKICEVGQDINKYGIPSNGNNCVIFNDNIDKGNIYCLSGIFTEHLSGERNDLEFNTRAFGESLILILNPREFINRVLDALKINGFENVQYMRVSYYSNEYSGNIGFFKKHEKFQHQNEFRIFIPNNQNELIKISIGSLKDIAAIEKNEMLKLVYTDQKEQTILI